MQRAGMEFEIWKSLDSLDREKYKTGRYMAGTVGLISYCQA